MNHFSDQMLPYNGMWNLFLKMILACERKTDNLYHLLVLSFANLEANMDESYVAVPIEESINQDKKESGVRISLSPCLNVCLWLPLALTAKKFCASKATSEHHICEDDMLYCSLCNVEVCCRYVKPL